MTEQKFTQLLLENQLNVDAETTLKWSIDTLMTTYTREIGMNLSIKESKDLLLSEIETYIEKEWR